MTENSAVPQDWVGKIVELTIVGTPQDTPHSGRLVGVGIDGCPTCGIYHAGYRPILPLASGPPPVSQEDIKKAEAAPASLAYTPFSPV